MRVRFSKLNGAGNDFVIIADFVDKLHLKPEQVARICDRHFGVGADGVILVKTSPRKECVAYMDYYNSDGTKAQMCGNGIRCFTKFLVDNNYVNDSADSFIVDTLSGPKPIRFKYDVDRIKMTVSVSMGKPELDAKLIPTTLAASSLPEIEGNEAFVNALKSTYKGAVIEQPVLEKHPELKVSCVSMGNPHAVCFLNGVLDSKEQLYADDLMEFGAAIESASVFPEKTNVEFAYIDEETKEDIYMRVYERGCGETLACGTGCCATAVAAYLSGRINKRYAKLYVLGGCLIISWEKDLDVQMIGSARTNFTGILELKNYR